MLQTTACALDCYDACKIVVEEKISHIAGDKDHPASNGALCSLLNKHMYEQVRIEQPRIDGEEVSMQEAMEAVKAAFETSGALLWRGSGNMGVMQEVTNLLMERLDGTLTHGSLCDGAGDAGIVEGRGINKILPLEQIAKADTVVIWGRNVTVTNAHMMPFIEGKKLIVIDPVKTAIAKRADMHLQIQPRTDYYLAIMLSRFIYMEDSQDTQWCEAFASEYEEFYEFTQEHRIKPILEYIGTDLGEMGCLLNYLRKQKVVFLVGTGVQKYSTGASTLHAIDSLAALLGLFGKEGCGVHYLGNSKLGFENPFDVACKTVSKVVTPFSKYHTVLVQGGNPAESMPDSKRVCKELDEVENLIYFGLYENETSKRAKIVIPAKNFFEKEDVRLSYGHHYVHKMNRVVESKIGISEYDFTKYLFDAFNLQGLEPEEVYIEKWLEQCDEDDEGNLISPAYEAIPYEEGFGEDGEEEFVFVDDYDDDFINTKSLTKVRTSKKNQLSQDTLWLITPKSNKALNTQFERQTQVQLHPALGYAEGTDVKISSEYGSIVLEVVLNEDLRKNCIVIPNNTIGINRLTPSIVSNEGENACYQEVKIKIETIEG